jgi:hypothetical protein
MNENRFVAVGRIERLIPTPRGLKLVIGGPGPIKGLVVVELQCAALVKVVSTANTGFVAGDIVSVSGRLEFDVDTLQNVAVASPDSVSRIARAPGKTEQTRAQEATAGGAGLFGVFHKPASSAQAAAIHVPPLPQGFPGYTPLDAEPVGLSDVPL